MIFQNGATAKLFNPDGSVVLLGEVVSANAFYEKRSSGVRVELVTRALPRQEETDRREAAQLAIDVPGVAGW